MRKRDVRAPGLALLLLALAGVLAGSPRGATAATLKVTPPKIDVRAQKLANGLQIYLIEDHSVPVADVQVWYHVGSKNERTGRTGFAHLFEHLMFKGSANVGPEEHAAFITQIGGRFNAETEFDRTMYYETIPSNYLERILWMEADRMQSLDVSAENFHSERDVVKEERRLRIDNPPFGRLFEVVLNKSFTTHPYRILPIGSMADLDAATLEDVRAFHSTYYVPNNATLVISGDFKPEQALAWVQKYFGSIPEGKPISREIAQEPAQTQERRAQAYDANAPLPAVIFSYHIPEARNPDIAALEVAGNILSNGESSRLYKKMVYEQQMALAAGGQTLALEDPGVFYFYAILQGSQKAEDGEKSLQEEVARIQAQPATQEEIEKAKNQLIADLVFGRQRVSQKGEAVAYASVILGDVSLANRQIEEYKKVTAEDVQRVAQKYFRTDNRTVVTMLPAALQPKEGDGKKEGKP
jgi:zinc protease